MKTESNQTAFAGEDLERFNQGNHDQIYNFLGAHPRTFSGVSGVNFAVWAPNAADVCVVGDFNQWQSGATRMNRLGGSGIWEIFVPNAKAGQIYRYHVTDSQGRIHEKSDPFGFFGEVPPKSASIVC